MQNTDKFIEDTIIELAIRLDEEDVSEYQKQVEEFCQGYNYRVFVPAAYGTREAVMKYEAVFQTIEWDGFSVRTTQFTDGILGRCEPRVKLIEIDERAATQPRILLLLHEWTHGLLHDGLGIYFLFDPAPFELEAEATAYVVGRALGIDQKHSVEYLKGSYGITGMAALDPNRVANIKRAATYQIERLTASGLL